MSNFTKYYNLPYNSSGQQISSSIDKQRFRKIDNLLGFFSQQIGDGVADGLNVSDISTLDQRKLSVSSGFGIISKNICHVYNNLQIDINNQVSYLYLQKKNGVAQGVSGFSNKAILSYLDVSAPSSVSGISIDSYDYNFIKIKWNNNTQADIKDYVIYKSLNNIDFTQLNSSLFNYYVDQYVLQNTAYYYKVKSRDVNNNLSLAYSLTVTATVPYNDEKPSPVSNLISFPLKQSVQLFWDKIQGMTYSIYVQRIDINGDNIGSVSIFSSSNNNLIVNSLFNGYIYKFSVMSVSLASVMSDPVSCINTVSQLSNVQVKDISVIQSEGSSEDSINCFIKFQDNVSSPLVQSSKYKIQIINNGILSSPIFISQKSINIQSYDSIKISPRSKYLIKITGIDVNDNLGIPVFYQLNTVSYKKPSAITSLSGVISGNKLFFSWNNSDSIFLYNKITVTKDNGVVDYLQINRNIEKNNNYTVDDIELDAIYNISVFVIDQFGNQSDEDSLAVNSISSQSVNTNPQVPVIQNIFSNDGYVHIQWSSSINDSIYIDKYYIWRSVYKQPLKYSDFSLIATISSDNKTFNDYSVQNNVGYYYFITSGDVFGNKSKNPVDDKFINYGMRSAYPHDDGYFSSPSGLSVSRTGNDANLSWDNSNDQFDGYEVLKSYNNIYNFQTVGYVSKQQNSFVDENGVLLSGNYYYVVRKIRQGARLVLSESQSIIPYFSILLAKISIVENNLVISSLSNQISIDNINILSICDDIINKHVHNLTSEKDLRISLSENLLVNNFVSQDLLTYTTTENINSAQKYIVKINGYDSNIVYSLDLDNNAIIFQQSLLQTDVVELLCIGLDQVENVLPKERVGKIFATNITRNLIKNKQIPSLSHDGRKEQLIPLLHRMESQDRTNYNILQNKYITEQKYVNTGITFYDIQYSGQLSLLLWLSLTLKQWITMDLQQWLWLDLFTVNSMIAATSSGVMISIDDGATWKLVFQSNIPVQRIYKASNNYLFIAVGNQIYLSENGASWIRTEGYQECTIVRDFSDDGNSIFASTDSGVFKLSLEGYNNVRWTKTSTLNAYSSECYGIYYSNVRGQLNVSNQIGIYKSYDQGQSWQIDDDGINDIVYRFNVAQSQYNQYVFAVTIQNLYRKSYLDDNFVRINKDKFKRSEKVQFIHHKVIVTTDEGFMVSDFSFDATSDIDIVFHKIIQLGTSSKRYDATCLKVIKGHQMVLGTDNLLFATLDIDNFYLLFSSSQGVSPTVYLNDKKICTHVYTSKNYVVFNIKNKLKDTVKVANQYKIFTPEKGTWIQQNFSSEIKIYINNINQFKILSSSINSSIVANNINNYQFISFNQSNSNSIPANIYLNQFQLQISRLRNIIGGDNSLLNQGQSLSQVFSKVFYKFHQTNSQILGYVKYYSVIDNNNICFDNEIFPINIISNLQYNLIPFVKQYLIDSSVNSGQKCTVNIIGGVFNFSEQKTKYDLVEVLLKQSTLRDIGQNSHSQIQNKISLIDSGLNFKLSNINNYNLIINRILLQRKSYSESLNNISQMVSDFNYTGGISPLTSWYDKLNSTIDYFQQSIIPNTDNCISYVYCAKKINNQIWVGGIGGLMCIDIADSSVRSMINFSENQTVVDIHQNDEGVYILTQRQIFFTEDYNNFIKITNKNITGVNKKISSIKSTLLIFTSYGSFYLKKYSDKWIYSSEINNIQDIVVSDRIYVFSDNNLYISNNGISWSFKKQFNQDVNSIVKINNLIYAGTNKGVQFDNSTFYGNNQYLSTVNILGDMSLSSSICVNSIVKNTDNNNIIAGDSSGVYYILQSGLWTAYTDSSLDCINKIIYSGNDIWLFSRNLFKSPDCNYHQILSIG